MEDIEALLGAEFDPSAFDLPPLAVAGETPGIPVSPDTHRDRVGGLLLGVAVGDALGACHEFRNQIALDKYTGLLEHRLSVCRRFQGGLLVGKVGQITDDTEMMITLADAIVDGGGYDGRRAVTRYLAWANSKCPFLGKNTRALFTGVKTYEGYRRRWLDLRSVPPAQWSQSNGCLMRAAPLAALDDDEWAAAVVQDCALTNSHPVCVDSVRAYICAARELLAGATPAAATAAALATILNPEVLAVVAAGRDQHERDITEQKGWALHAMHCAFLALNDPAPSFEARIDRVVRLGGDTDTNAAIAGALLGAQLGEAAMRGEARTGPNIDTVLGCDSAAGGLPRPAKYAAARIPALADALANLRDAPVEYEL
jgi:ADP-ribosylglycohydrolase